MKTNETKMTDVKGISSRAAANRLATLMLVVPANVMAFQNNNPEYVELRTEDRSAVVAVLSTGTYLCTKVGDGPERAVFESSDKETARRILRFFDY